MWQRKASIPNEGWRSYVCVSDYGEVMMRTKWSLTIHHEDQGKRSVVSENRFNNFADLHATMKRNKGKIFLVIIPKTAKSLEIRAFHNLKQLGYLVEAR
jgi:hypothetical protein